MRQFYGEYYPKRKDNGTTASFNFGSHRLVFSNKEDEAEILNRYSDEPEEIEIPSFRSMSAKWRKEYDEVPQEEIDARILFDVAKRHGERMASLYKCLDDLDKFHRCGFTTPVQKFLNRLKGVKEKVYDETENEIPTQTEDDEAFEVYRRLRRIGHTTHYWLDRDCDGGRYDETKEVD